MTLTSCNLNFSKFKPPKLSLSCTTGLSILQVEKVLMFFLFLSLYFKKHAFNKERESSRNCETEYQISHQKLEYSDCVRIF